MSIPKLDINNIIGLNMGLLLVNQSIRSMIYYNFMPFFYFVLLGIYMYKLISKYKIVNINFNNNDLIIFLSYFFMLCYAFLTLYETGFHNFIYILELMSLYFLYLIGRIITAKAYVTIIKVILVVGVLQSSLLIYNRGYIYDSGVNYLLLSLTIGLYTCLSLLYIIFTKSNFSKLLFLFIYLVGWAALFNMQSRAVFLVVALYSLVMPFLLISLKNKLKLLIFMVIFLFYNMDLIINFYADAVIYERLFELYYNFKGEPRFLVYGLFFENISNFFLVGYGVNGTATGIYSNTVDKYPHNFIFEFISEFGILGLLFSFFFIFKSMYTLSKQVENNFYILTILTMYLYYLINFMKSFSIYDSYVLFFVIGLVFNKELIFDFKNKYKGKTCLTLQ